MFVPTLAVKLSHEYASHTVPKAAEQLPVFVGDFLRVIEGVAEQLNFN
jgi:hypothetical protein